MTPEEILQHRSIPKQVGQKLVDICDQVLAENLKRQPTSEELGELAQTMVSELLSAAYLIIRSGPGGPAEAETWLRRTLGASAAAVRLRGSDAFIKIDISIREEPNKIARKPPTDPAAQLKHEPPPVPPCVCEKGAEGPCKGCVEKISARFLRVFGHFHQMMKFQQETKDEGECKACAKESLDPAFASVVPRIFNVEDQADPDLRLQLAHEIMGVITQMASAAGVTEMPLTTAAWKQELERAGIAVEPPR